MSKIKTTASAALLALGMSLTGTGANAALILVAPENFGGSGLGSVNTILTINSPNNSTVESGSVSFNGTTDVITGSTALTGASQTQTRTIGSLGLTDASMLRVVFNAVEPGNAGSITLTNLVLSIFSSTGATLFTSGAFSPISFTDTFTGTGNSGFVFRLDAADTLAAQAAGFGSTSNRIGLTAAASSATGGNETFFVAAAGSRVVTVPEPATMGLFSAALLGLWGVRRKAGAKPTAA